MPSNMERVENIKMLCEALTNRWPAMNEHQKRSHSATVAAAFKQITEQQWRMKAWEAMQPYQRVLGKVINYLPGTQI